MAEYRFRRAADQSHTDSAFVKRRQQAVPQQGGEGRAGGGRDAGAEAESVRECGGVAPDMRRRPGRAVSACRMRADGPDTLMAAHGRPVWSNNGAGDAADALLVLLVVERVAAAADAHEVVARRSSSVYERARREALERLGVGVAAPRVRRPRTKAMIAFPGPVVCAERGGPDRGEHAHGARALDLVDVDHAVGVERDEVHRLPRLALDSPRGAGARPRAAASEPVLEAAPRPRRS